MRSVSKVVNMFKQLNVDVLTRWRQAHAMLLDAEEWKADDELRKLPTLDILLAFEDYSRVREREFEEQTRRTQVQKTRKERKAREAFKVRSYLPTVQECREAEIVRAGRSTRTSC